MTSKIRLTSRAMNDVTESISRAYETKISSERNATTTAKVSNNQTLHVPRCLSGRNEFLFPGVGKSRLIIVKDPSTPKKIIQTCVGSLTVPVEKFIAFKSNPFKISGSCKSMYSSGVTLKLNGRISVRPCERYIIFYSRKNEVKFTLTFNERIKPFSVNIDITAHDKDYSRQLDVSYQTNFSGTVTPYGFDGFTDYAMDMDAKGDVFPPPGYSVMVTFPHLDIKFSDVCREDVLELYINRRWMWAYCGIFWLTPCLYRGNLRFRFISIVSGNSGFKVRFSFHAKSKLPEKLLTTDDNTAIFNCSVPFYLKFKEHLECNLDIECAQAEDEANCPYSRGTCHPGFLNDGEKCYKYIKFGRLKTMTWYDASTVCLKQGLTLVSFPTSRREEKFRDEILRFAFPTNIIYIGLRTSDPSLHPMYRDLWQWSSGIMGYNQHTDTKVFKPTCAVINTLLRGKQSAQICGKTRLTRFVICDAEASMIRKSNLPRIETNFTYSPNDTKRIVTCPEGHVTHDFLSCDYESQCGAGFGLKACITNGSMNLDNTQRRVNVLMYVCDSQTQTIHYTSLCDFVPQCFDSSDESFCIHISCSEKRCLNDQCVKKYQWCDGMANCYDGSDEHCPQFVTETSKRLKNSLAGFHVALFDGYGKYRYVPQGKEFPVCPPTHFLCANRELCLPVYVRCNGVSDCPDMEDEDKCDDVTCPGYYKCRRTSVCVHEDHLCDGVFQCPEQDDELLCQLVCPDGCLCQGLAFVCPRPFPVRAYSELRYLDASQSGLTPDQLFHNHYLVRLVLASCELSTLPVLVFPNLIFLDLSYNLLTNVSMLVFFKLTNLGFITLSGNSLSKLVSSEPNKVLENVHSIDLSLTNLSHFDSATFRNIPNVQYVNLSYSLLEVIATDGFVSLTQIKILDLRGTDLKDYPVNMLKSLSSLRELFSDVYKLCCPDILPETFNTQNCHTSPDEISSCKDLLRSEIYRMFLWMFCIFALIGNAGSFAAKVYMQRGKPPNSFNVFISNLNIADFFMGLYLAVVGFTDQTYRGRYLWHDEEWKTSVGCKTAGFMSLLSCEVSAFIICLITLDRILVMRFPFSQLRFRNKSATVVCVLGWVIGVALASLPLLPMMSHWEFFSQTDICIPLPITRQNFKGRQFSFGILIVLNFILFVFIAVGQLSIYMSVRANSMTTDQKNAREATVARRLLTVVMSDFLCWFPIGLLGLLASNGVSIPGEINVAMAIFALPLNSALNPFLYTFNLIMERRRKASEERLLKMLQARISGLNHECAIDGVKRVRKITNTDTSSPATETTTTFNR